MRRCWRFSRKAFRRVVLRRSLPALLVAAGLAAAGCRDQPPPAAAPVPIASVATPPASADVPAATAAPAPTRRDLSIDEPRGGHTLSRHVGRTDDQLRERLRKEPQISAASTYTDRAIAEETVAAALAESKDELEMWTSRSGQRPNFVIEYESPRTTPIGRSLRRGPRMTVPCRRALVVLRWDDRNRRYYVLTSYPEDR